MNINSVNISGNVTRDAEYRQSASGTGILTFGLAVNDRVRNPQTQELEDKPNFVDCVIFGKRADSLNGKISKGMKLVLSGKLSYSSWERDGQKRSKLEVFVNDLDFMKRKEDQQNGSYVQQPQQYNNYPQQPQYAPQNGYQQPTGGYQQQYAPQPPQGYTEQQVKHMAGGSVNNPANYSGDMYSTDRPF